MQITFFSSQPYDKTFFHEQNKKFNFKLDFLNEQLNETTAELVRTEAICAFVNDRINSEVLEILQRRGVKIIALRCAGFNNIDINKAIDLGIKVVRVPAYAPEAVAEHALAMIMTLNRKTHKSYNRVREQNFSLNGLLGFNLSSKTIGVIGTGNIGKVFCHIMLGIGKKVVAHDINPDEDLERRGVLYLPLDEVFRTSDIISLHCPLNDKTKYLINKKSIHLMKNEVMIINTSRGGLIDTKAMINALKEGKIHSLGIDVYEQEASLFFRDLSEDIIQDDVIVRLMSFPNVLITAHQGFFTEEALTQISFTTLNNLNEFKDGLPLTNEVK
ncbi:MAG: 2-hydroxyacid dehydrogenase [Bacteriovoracaceae bacterium]